MNRYEFLDELHQQLRPRGYLEIGVQSGASLTLATCPAVGIDPDPHVTEPVGPSTTVVTATSDDFFTRPNPPVPQPLDLVFIDGLHLFEQVLRDFGHVQRYTNPRTVVVFDDVLPRTVDEATRVMPPRGDWAGDVWRIRPWLALNRPDLQLTLVDLAPTGLLLVRGFGATPQPGSFPVPQGPPPQDVLDRADALNVYVALTAVSPR